MGTQCLESRLGLADDMPDARQAGEGQPASAGRHNSRRRRSGHTDDADTAVDAVAVAFAVAVTVAIAVVGGKVRGC